MFSLCYTLQILMILIKISLQHIKNLLEFWQLFFLIFLQYSFFPAFTSLQLYYSYIILVYTFLSTNLSIFAQNFPTENAPYFYRTPLWIYKKNFVRRNQPILRADCCSPIGSIVIIHVIRVNCVKSLIFYQSFC